MDRTCYNAADSQQVNSNSRRAFLKKSGVTIFCNQEVANWFTKEGSEEVESRHLGQALSREREDLCLGQWSGPTNSASSPSPGGRFQPAITTRDKACPKCWGLNSSGQLGDDTTSDRTTPVLVTVLDVDVLDVTPGDLTYGFCHLGAQLCAPPETMSDTPLPNPTTSTGLELSFVVPSPN